MPASKQRSRWCCSLAVASLLVLGAACKREPKIVLSKVSVALEGDDGRELLGLGDDEVKQKLEAALASRGFVLPKADSPHPKEPKWRCSLAALMTPPNSSRPDAQARAVLVLERVDEDGEHEVDASASVKPSGDGLEEQREAARRALDLVLADAAARLRSLMTFAGLSDRELEAKLASNDTKEQQLAVDALAERKSPAAVEPLIQRLKTDDLTQARRAMGALLLIKDVRAVSPLIEAARGKDEVFQREVVFALGALGGEEAEAYLTMMAEGHDAPLMRASAQAALEELKGRADGGERVPNHDP